MSSPSILVTDFFNYRDIPLLSDASQYVSDLMKDSSKKVSLTAVSNATYSGYLLNGRVYPGKYVKAGTPTWTDAQHGGVSPYNAPVLRHHNDYEDAIGRVVHAEYFHIKSGADWENDWKNPSTGLEKGSGYSRLTLNISDQDAIEKFLDGRHATLSTTSVSKNLICSVCGHDAIKDRSLCEHRPGKEYERETGCPLGDGSGKVLAYYITGPKTYKEVSVVNDPAQPFAVIDEVKLISDSISKQNNLDGLCYRGTLDVPNTNLALIIRDDVSGSFVPLTIKEGQKDAIPDGAMKPNNKVTVPVNIDLDKAIKDLSSAMEAKFEAISKEIQAMAQETVKPAEAPAAQPDAKQEKSLEALSEQIGRLNSEIKTLTGERDAKKAELEAALADGTKLKAELHKERCLRLASLRAVTVGEVEGKDLRSLDGINKYADSLAARGSDSIADSLKDEAAVFGAKVVHVRGLPKFIESQPIADPAAQIRKSDAEEIKPTSKDKTVDI